jgi:hypothetical protein
MKPQIQLDPELLKHYRDKNDLTQTELADAVIGKPGDWDDKKASRLSTYHFIEKTGRTSPARAERIALVLGCTVQDLQNPTDALDRPWWVEFADPVNYELGVVVLGSQGAIHRIEQAWPKTLERLLEGGKEIIAKLVTDEKHYRLDVGSPDIDYTWKAVFCACSLSKETGIRWDFANKWERDFLRITIKDQLFSHADTVWMDEQRYPPIGSTEVIQNIVHEELNAFHPVMGSSPITQLFYSWQDFYVSFRDFSENFPESCFSFKFIANGFEILLSQVDTKRRSSQPRITKRFSIKQGWMNAEGGFEEGPFPVARIKHHIEHTKLLGNIPVSWEGNEPIPIFGVPSENAIAESDDARQSKHEDT